MLRNIYQTLIVSGFCHRRLRWIVNNKSTLRLLYRKQKYAFRRAENVDHFSYSLRIFSQEFHCVRLERGTGRAAKRKYVQTMINGRTFDDTISKLIARSSHGRKNSTQIVKLNFWPYHAFLWYRCMAQISYVSNTDFESDDVITWAINVMSFTKNPQKRVPLNDCIAFLNEVSICKIV